MCRHYCHVRNRQYWTGPTPSSLERYLVLHVLVIFIPQMALADLDAQRHCC